MSWSAIYAIAIVLVLIFWWGISRVVPAYPEGHCSQCGVELEPDELDAGMCHDCWKLWHQLSDQGR